MTMDDVKNSSGISPQTSGCLAKNPPNFPSKNPQIPCARSVVFLFRSEASLSFRPSVMTVSLISA